METGYSQSADDELLRAFASGGYATCTRCIVGIWLVARSPLADVDQDLAHRIDETWLHVRLRHQQPDHAADRETDFYTSHEALLLPL